MASEAKDPREAVLEIALRHAYRRGLSDGRGNGASTGPAPTETLARLDAADPIRQLLPEVVGALEAVEGARREGETRVLFRDDVNAVCDLLTRIRAITPEGGECPTCGDRGIVGDSHEGEEGEIIAWDTHCPDCTPEGGEHG